MPSAGASRGRGCRRTGYDWNFIQASGPAFADSGSQSCRGLLDTQAPSPPGALSATAESPTQVKLSWSASADNVALAGYEIWRGPANGPLATVATTGAGVGFVDATVTARQQYQYQVRAHDTAGNVSAMSNVVSVVTPAYTKLRRSALLAKWRVKRATARRALARGRIDIRARRWAPTVISVRVGNRVAAQRTVRSKRAITMKLAS